MQCLGGSARDRPGTIFRSVSTTGTALSSASAAGHPRPCFHLFGRVRPREGIRRGAVARGHRRARSGGGEFLKKEPEGAPGSCPGDVQMETTGREPVRKNQVPCGCDAVLQDGRELRGGGSSCRGRGRGDMSVNRHMVRRVLDCDEPAPPPRSGQLRIRQVQHGHAEAECAFGFLAYVFTMP